MFNKGNRDINRYQGIPVLLLCTPCYSVYLLRAEALSPMIQDDAVAVFFAFVREEASQLLSRGAALFVLVVFPVDFYC